MIEKIAKRISLYLREDDIIDKKMEDVYTYGIQILIINLIGIINAIFIGILFSAVVEVIIFLLPFIITRRYSGGFHTNALWKCLLTTALMLISVLCIYKYLSLSILMCVLCSLVAILIFILFVPVDNENKRLDYELKQKNKKISLLNLIVFCMVGFILLLFDIRYYNLIFLSIGFITLFVIISVCIERGKRNESNFKNDCKSIS